VPPTRLTIAELAGHVGETLGSSEWVTIGLDDIRAFAEATGDQQWIHVDQERAQRGPFGAPIAQGYLLITVIASLFPQILLITDRGMSVNYGTNRVRFLAPARAGAEVRLTGHLSRVEGEDDGSALIHVDTRLDLRDSGEPAAEAQLLFLVRPR
jgi:acyl dehydratase